MNVVNLVGRLGRDPEISTTNSGLSLCKIALATSKKIKGEQVTQWHRCVAFGKTADLIAQYLGKGDQMGVEGELSYGSYEKDGVKHYTSDIIINRIHFISGSKTSSGGQYSNPPANTNHPPAQHNPQNQHATQPPVNYDDDLPF